MNWMHKMYQIYEENCGRDDDGIILLPVFHLTINAQVQVTLSESGEFLGADRIESKEDAITVIPVTEKSGARSSGNTPHPLTDKLLYIAGDYPTYATGKRSLSTVYYNAYINQLRQWKQSSDTHPAVCAIFDYLEKGTLIKDLLHAKVLVLDETTGKLSEKEKILGISQQDITVRFYIEYSDQEYDERKECRTWKDKSLYECFISYQTSCLGNEQLCYATGEMCACTYTHPVKIRHAGDKAKLISSSDESGFTYRGRFRDKTEALSVGYEFSQKVHNALRWLIARQGITLGSSTVLIWSTDLQDLPNVIGNLHEDAEIMEEAPETSSTLSDMDAAFTEDERNEYEKRIQRLVFCGKSKEDFINQLEDQVNVEILTFDAATTGRLAVTMYDELKLSEFYENVIKWYLDTSWIRYNGKLKRRELHSFSLYEIANYAFGHEQGDFVKCKPEVLSKTILRLIPCITTGEQLPKDIVRNVVLNASRPSSYSNDYNWKTALEIACGLIRKTIIEDNEKYKIRGNYEVAIDNECKDRSYLYGRLLAIADVAERVAQVKDLKRPTNVQRFFEAFSNRPYDMWGYIYKRLLPYLNRMPLKQRHHYEELITNVQELFSMEDFTDNSKLQPLFLLGYHSQLNSMSIKREVSKEEE